MIVRTRGGSVECLQIIAALDEVNEAVDGSGNESDALLSLLSSDCAVSLK